MKKTYTILINFSDHIIGIGQFESDSPELALKDFIKTHESLDGYDRQILFESLMALLQFKDLHNVWYFGFDSNLLSTLEWHDDNPILGGHIVQSAS